MPIAPNQVLLVDCEDWKGIRGVKRQETSTDHCLKVDCFPEMLRFEAQNKKRKQLRLEGLLPNGSVYLLMIAGQSLQAAMMGLVAVGANPSHPASCRDSFGSPPRGGQRKRH